MRVPQIQVRQAAGGIVYVLPLEHRKPEFVAPGFEGRLGIRNDDGKMIEPIVFHERFTSTGTRFSAEA